MTKIPPLLPEETFHRVLRLARMDGFSVLMIAGLLALAAAAGGDYIGAIIGLLVAGAGAIELHGEGLLRDGHVRGMGWLVGSQMYLMVVIIGYCVFHLSNVDPATVPKMYEPLMKILKPMIELSAQQWRMTTDEYLVMVHRLTYRLLAVLTFLYQGGMALYYSRRRDAVASALAQAREHEAGAY